MELDREYFLRMMKGRSAGAVVVEGSEGGGGGATLGPLLASLNAVAMPTAEGYLHWTGSAWEFPPIDLSSYATKQWVLQQGYITSSAISDMATKTWVGQQGFATTSQLSHYLALTGGTMEDSIITPGSDSYGIYPETDRYGFIGKSTNWYWNIYGSRLYAEKMELYVYSSGSRSLYGGIDNNNFYLYPGTNSYKFNVDSNGYVTAQKFVKDGGTSSQFLKANGDVDSSVYLKGVTLNSNALTVTNNTVNIPIAGANTPGVVQVGTGLTTDQDHLEVDTTVIATQSWVNSQGHVASAGALKYSGNTKVEATSVGTTVTGVLTSTAGFTVDNRSYNISVKQSLDVSGSWPVYNIQFHDTGTATANVCTFAFNGTVESSNGFKKTGSSDDNVLLGGGGTKAVSDFATWMDSSLRAKGLILMNGDTPTLKSPKVTVECVNQGAGRYSLNFTGSYIDSSDVVTPYAPTHYEFDSEVRATAFNANQIVAKTFGVLNSNDTNGVYIHWDSNGYLNIHGDTAPPRGYVFDAPVTQSSDARLKSIVSHAVFEVDKLATLPLVWFTWKKDERRRMHFGSIAQEWQKVLPEVVSENGDGMLAMDYGAAAMAAGVTACREVVALKKEIEELKEIINQLKQ